MNQRTCRNCDNNFAGEYCNKCGQKIGHRITMGHIAHDLLHAFTHADKGFFHMMIQLFKNPGKVAREYILEGKRKRYFTPFQYILIIGTLATFVVVNSHYMEGALAAMRVGPTEVSSKQAVVMQKLAYLQSRYYNILILIQLPFLSIATLWLYKKHKYNYAEHLTLHTFITAQTTLISMCMMIILFFIDRSNMNVFRVFTTTVTIIAGLYHIIMYMQFFRQKGIGGFFKALLAYVAGLLIFFLSIFILGMLGTIIYLFLMKH